MWDTLFEPSMLGNPIIIHCPDKSNVEDLMAILRENGVKWCTGESPTAENACWGIEKENTVYYVEEQEMSFGNIKYTYNDNDYIRCTFNGADSPNFDVATDDEFLDFLGIGGA